MRRLLLSFVFLIAFGFMLSCDSIDANDSDGLAAIETTEESSSSESNTTQIQGDSAGDTMTAAEQKAFFKTYVSIGDSLTQGCQGLNVEENRTYYMLIAQLARAIGTGFNQPLIEFPGVRAPNPGKSAVKNSWYDTSVDHHIEADQDFSCTGTGSTDMTIRQT